MPSNPFVGPAAVAYRDPSSPFTIDLTLGSWEAIGSAGPRGAIEITIAAGILRDADKGTFPLAGVVLRMRAASTVEPLAVVNPGALSELQQIGILDAVSTHLNTRAMQEPVLGIGASRNHM